MPSPAPEPLAPRPLTVWLVNPFDDIPGEGLPPLRYWTLARILAARGHDVTWWSGTWSHRRKAVRMAPLGIREDEGFSVRLVATPPYTKNVSLARLRNHREFGKTFERLANESVASGQLERPDIIVASLPPLEGPEAALRLARRMDATCVVDLMDVWPETFERLVPGPTFIRKPLAQLFFGGMHRRRRELLAAADGVSAATHTYAAQVLGEAAADLPRHVCYVGAYLQEFPPPPRSIDAVPLPDGSGAAAAMPEPLQCVYAGSLGSGQDLDALVAAARGLSAAGTRTVLHVAGTGPLEPMLRTAAAAQRGACELRIHGLLPRADYVRLLGSCDVGLVLVKPESLPGELAGLIEEHAAGVAYTAGDGGSLTRAITALATDRRSLLALRAGSRRLAAAAFDRERTYPAFVDWLETLSE
ncbi:MAG: glycosyltransferase family 4 protein [Planctomycetaceae bacterium]|nr:glycosyltransferase family 4 protein [Planctomycetaceae bacterium]